MTRSGLKDEARDKYSGGVGRVADPLINPVLWIMRGDGCFTDRNKI